jgi:uncharacterized protein with ParB-like and HNH nuclease domain
MRKKSKIEELEKETFEEDDSQEIPPSDIVSYNELRSCADLFRMYRDEILIIQPEFQREIVWKTTAQTRFLDSLIKQLPIPSMCFSLDYKTQKWIVIDGLQRMATIIKFLEDRNWRLSKLEDIDPKISGMPVSAFHDTNSDLNIYLKRIENLTIPITVLRCDSSKRQHTLYLFTIFHRLNTGGMKLNNQEIRNCIYSGSFNNLLKELNKNSLWKKINKIKGEGHRFIKQELILRFFAFYDQYEKYNGGLSRFLNEYMDTYKEAKEKFIINKKRLFERTVEVIYRKLFEGKIPQKLSNTVIEALFVGVSKNISALEQETSDNIKKRYKIFIGHENFSESALSEGLSAKSKVKERLTTVINIFS